MINGELDKINIKSEPFSTIDITILEEIEKYQVFATVEHVGEQLYQGHYVSYLSQNNKWFLCNDQIITQLNEGDESATKNVYILILKKMTR